MNIEQQARYESLETEKQALNMNNPDDKFRLTIIEQEQAKIRTQMDEQDRLTRQAVEVSEIQLPQDYDVIWGAGANEEIRHLIREVKAQLFAAHNDEVATLAEAHRAQLATAQAEILSLSSTVQKLENDLDAAQEQIDAWVARANKAEDELQDVESKRDNAVRSKEEAESERDRANGEVSSLKRQIDELEGMIRTYKSQSSGGYGGGLKLTSTIKPESDDERKARAERERIEQINRGLTRMGHEPLPLPVRPEEPVTQEDVDLQSDAVEEAAEDAERFPAVVSDDTAGSEAAAGAEEAAADAGDVSPATLEARVAELEEWRKKIDEHLFTPTVGVAN